MESGTKTLLTMFILLLFLLVGCHDATRVASPIQPLLSIYGGNNQVAFDTTSSLRVPFSVRVVDADGRPVPAIRVEWRVIGGSGELTAYPGGELLTLTRSCQPSQERESAFQYADYLSYACAARFKSTSVPPGGTPFDSGVIHAGDTFEFKPDAVGNWTFTDAINGGSGTLIVRPPA